MSKSPFFHFCPAPCSFVRSLLIHTQHNKARSLSTNFRYPVKYLKIRHSFQEILGYLERQYDDILSEESRIKRNPRFRDNRVHALLYFIAPTGHR